MWRLILTGAAAGLAFGYVLQRSDLCFHSLFRGIFERRYRLLRAWAVAAPIAAVGLAIVFALGPWDQLSRGLGFRPVANIVGGLLIGVGMVVASSCVSGLFYRLGSGMAGAAAGLGGWAIGELFGRQIRLPGPTVLSGGDAATIPGILGVPRLAVAVPWLVIAWILVGRRPGNDAPDRAWTWNWRTVGIVVGVATVAAWILAGIGGASFGPSTTGAVASIADGHPAWWLVAFLVALVGGASIGARTAGGWWLRGETGARLRQLFAGGLLLGAGGIIAGGCNLGHGLSGLAQMNVSSVVVVAAMISGVGVARAVALRVVALRAGPRTLSIDSRAR